jgi:probable F420-dependent oxidoreductase
MGLGFGLLSAQLRPGETDWSTTYQETIALAVEAERLGLSSIWTTEHHFVDDGYMPSLLVVSAAIAAATSRIEIGTGVLLAPLHDPLRLAEDAATVGLISSGRLALGLGLGWSETEFAALGADIRRRGAAMEEILEILPEAWSGRPLERSSGIYRFPEVAVRPTPSRKIPILIGGGAEPALRRAARLADGIFANAPVDKLIEQVGWISDELAKLGRDPSTFRVIHYSVMLPGQSEQEAMDRYQDDLWQMMWKYSDMEASARRMGPPPTAPALTDETRSRIFERSTIAGTPDQIVDTLSGIRERVGIEIEFVTRSFLPTLGHAQQIELMQQLAEEVAPHI